MFLVKREESRSFDVFFGCFLVFGREKKYVERLGKRQISEKSVSPIYRVLRAIYSPGHVFRGDGPYRVTGLERPQNEWILTHLERS